MTGKHAKGTKKRKRMEKGRRPSQEESRGRAFETEPVNQGHEKLIQWFQTVHFRKTLFGGVDEVQLWKKLEELDRLYEAALIEERARCDALLEEQKAASGAVISKYKRELEKLSQPEQDSGQAEPGDLPDREERG